MTAREGYLTDMSMYKAPDYRCLKPIGKPHAWPHYDMPQHRAAKTKAELKKVEVVPFDINFLNMEDPKVFKAMTHPKLGPELWKKTYGMDFVAFAPKPYGNPDYSKCHQACLRAEYSDFAQNCKKSGGFFKCCMQGYTFSCLMSLH